MIENEQMLEGAIEFVVRVMQDKLEVADGVGNRLEMLYSLEAKGVITDSQREELNLYQRAVDREKFGEIADKIISEVS